MSIRDRIRRMVARQPSPARVDAVLDRAQQASVEAERQARSAGHSEHDVAVAGVVAWHDRAQQLMGTTITYGQLIDRGDERDGTDLAALAEHEAWLAELTAHHEREDELARKEAEDEIERSNRFRANRT